jgi:hypothetical protein
MKTLETRARELREQAAADEAADEARANKEATIANGLSLDIEQFASKAGIQLQTSTTGNIIKVEGDKRDPMEITVSVLDDGDVDFIVESQNGSVQGNQDVALEAILSWLR